MAVPIDELTRIDYEILKYVGEHEPVQKKTILVQFKQQKSIENRMAILSDFTTDIPNYLQENGELVRISWPGRTDFNDFKGNDTYSLTAKGIKVLDDYLMNETTVAQRSRTERNRYRITTGISAFALILSAIALYVSLNS